MDKRVAIVLPNLAGGGAERVALASAAHLVRHGHQVDLVLLQAKGELLPLVVPGVRVVDLHAPRIGAALPQLVHYLREYRPNTVHAHMWPLTVVAIIASRIARSGARVVVTDHVHYSRKYLSATQMRLLQLTVRLFYPLATHRTVVAKAAADALSKLSGIARERFEVFYNPISAPKRIATNNKVEALWMEKGPRIITVGNLKAQKNHALLLEAFALLSDTKARLMILGQGPLQPALERQAAELGISERVIFAGFTLDPWPYLASADVFVLSSDYEGLPLVLAEAMQAGLKMVSTDCMAGPSEMLDGGRFGRLTPCGDAQALAAAIEATLFDPPQRDRQRARAREISGPKVLDRYTELLTR